MIFDSPWETVAQAVWRKYPNKFNPSVSAVDVADRHVKDGVLHSERIMASKWSIARWIEGIIGSHSAAYSQEFSQVDPKNRTFTLQVKNLSLGNCLSLREKLVYKAHDEEPHKTHFHMEQHVTVFGIPLSSYLENTMADAVRSNSAKGRLVSCIFERLN